MITIKEIIEENENVYVEVACNEKEDMSSWPSSIILYEGNLYDIPEENRDLEVLSVGWLIGSQHHRITIRKGAWK